MITLQQEKFNDYIDEALPLLHQHWKEVAINQGKIALEIDYGRYYEACNNGSLKIYTARDGGKLIGYLAMVVTPHLHYMSHKFAMNDVIYVSPGERGKGTARDLIRYAENKLKKEGVSVMMINTKNHKPFDPLLEKLDFSLQDKLYSKYIGD